MKGWVNEGNFVPSIFRQDLVVYDTEERYRGSLPKIQQFALAMFGSWDLPNTNFGLFISLVRSLGYFCPKIAVMK